MKRMPDCGAAVSVMKRLKTLAIPEHLNRCLPVTDKRKSAWQKRAIRCKGGPLKSVCRELPRVALLHQGGLCIVCV